MTHCTRRLDWELKCQAFQKEAVVNCGNGDYNESLPNTKGLFVPTLPGPHQVNIMGLRVKGGESEMFFVHRYLSPVCVWHRGLQRAQKKRKGRVRTSMWCYRGVNWHMLLAWAQCMVGWQRPGAAWKRQKLLGAKAASQWGCGERRARDQIRSRGENWDRFSCRCWDNRRTNDVIVAAFLNRIQLRKMGGCGDYREAAFKLQRQTGWHMPTWKPGQTQEVCQMCIFRCVVQYMKREVAYLWFMQSLKLYFSQDGSTTLGMTAALLL